MGRHRRLQVHRSSHATPSVFLEYDAVVDRFLIEELLAVRRYEARCTVVFDGARHTFLVRSTLADSELEGVRIEWAPELERRLCGIPGGPDGVVPTGSLVLSPTMQRRLAAAPSHGRNECRSNSEPKLR
jgi:hypothetical protein